MAKVGTGDRSEDADGESKRDRAQLWALYFGIQAINNPPGFIRQTEDDLRRHLSVDEPAGGEVVSLAGLRRVK